MFRIAICDDEISELDKVEQMLQSYHTSFMEQEFLIRRFGDSEELFLQITEQNYQPDLIFMDIYLPKTTGIEMARKLRDGGNNSKIVFLTSSQAHALEAFGVEAFSYLVKPVTAEKLFAVLDKAFKRMADGQPRYILLKADDSVLKVEAGDIIYCEAQRKRQCVYLRGGRSISMRVTMKKLAELLCVHKMFVKLGVSYIVNLEHIEQLGSQTLLLDNGTEICIPRGSYKELRRNFFQYVMRTEICC